MLNSIDPPLIRTGALTTESLAHAIGDEGFRGRLPYMLVVAPEPAELHTQASRILMQTGPFGELQTVFPRVERGRGLLPGHWVLVEMAEVPDIHSIASTAGGVSS